MTNPTAIKELVRDRYGAIARTGSSCCGPSCGTGDISNLVGDAYRGVDGHVAEADLGLGCGVPTQHAGIRPGDTVLDLGSGAGNDVFIARRIVGDAGRVIGVDMTRDMNERAQANAARLGYANVEFRQGDIEDLPVEDGTIDVVISNCVLNLVPDKARAFAEIFRVLKPGAHFCVSDVVSEGELPAALRADAELYVGCVAGAMDLGEYLDVVRRAGFTGVEVRQSKPIDLPEDVRARHLPAADRAAFEASGARVLSVTVVASKPAV